ncbi:MAG: hypothetical protein J5642_02565 [Bacteroidales bacterium]|nr:hypothetical protein [Bacteroidales bacterium]
MKPQTKTTIILLAIIAVVIFLVYRQKKKNATVTEKKKRTATQTTDEKPWYPKNIEDYPNRLREFNRRYLVFLVAGRTYYAHKSGKYAGYAYSPHNNVKVIWSDGTITYSDDEHINYMSAPKQQILYPSFVTYQGKQYEVLAKNIQPDMPYNDSGHRFMENHPGYTGGWSEYYCLIPELHHPEMLDN